MHQLLHLVIGGELKEVGGVEFRDLSKVDLVGAYPNYEEAFKAWKARAQATVDNALIDQRRVGGDPSAPGPGRGQSRR